MRLRRSVFHLPSSIDADADGGEREARVRALRAAFELDRPFTLRGWRKAAFGPSLIPGGNRPQKQLWYGAWILAALLGLVIPETILDLTWARWFSDFMASIIPMIDIVTEMGLKPEINRFHYSVLWAMSPILFFACYRSVDEAVKRSLLKLSRRTAFWHISGCLGLALPYVWLWPFYWGDELTRTQLRFQQAAFNTDLSRSVWAGMYMLALIGFLTAPVVYIKHLFTGKLIKEESDGHG